VLPGVSAFLLIASGLVVRLIGMAATPDRRPPSSLVVLLALASPVGVLVAGHNLFLFPRNLSASLPFAALLAGWALTPPRRAAMVVAVGLAGLGMGLGAAKTLQVRFHRPNTPGAAAFVDGRARPGDLVIHSGSGAQAFVLDQVMRIYYARHHRLLVAPELSTADFERTDGRVFLVQLVTSKEVVPPSFVLWQRVEDYTYSGFLPVRLTVYRRRG